MMPDWIHTPQDLITPAEKTRQGFIEQMLEKGRQVDPFLEQARIFKDELAAIDHLETALDTEKLRSFLLTAAGFSEKSRKHLTQEDLETGLQKTLYPLIYKHQKTWKDELVFRYLLTFGDALGGVMRNWVGMRGAALLTEALQEALQEQEKSYEVPPPGSGKVKGLYWSDRCLLFDRKPGLIGNNVDVILLRCTDKNMSEQDRLERQKDYLACGELKGGIDPAGADEHWKTARSALNRIREKFNQLPPPALFFVGAAITKKMAGELYDWLKRGELAAAANLTQPQQVKALADWLVALP
jgi:type II restriction enzyme